MSASDYEQYIGKHITETPNQWDGVWPEINERGYVTGVFAGDSIPDDATLVDWSSKNKRGHVVVVDGMNGFEAVL